MIWQWLCWAFANLFQPHDACYEKPCLNGATCTSDGYDFTCTCAYGYSGPTCAVRRFLLSLSLLTLFSLECLGSSGVSDENITLS